MWEERGGRRRGDWGEKELREGMEENKERKKREEKEKEKEREDATYIFIVLPRLSMFTSLHPSLITCPLSPSLLTCFPSFLLFFFLSVRPFVFLSISLHFFLSFLLPFMSPFLSCFLFSFPSCRSSFLSAFAPSSSSSVLCPRCQD